MFFVGRPDKNIIELGVRWIATRGMENEEVENNEELPKKRIAACREVTTWFSLHQDLDHDKTSGQCQINFVAESIVVGINQELMNLKKIKMNGCMHVHIPLTRHEFHCVGIIDGSMPTRFICVGQHTM